MAWDAAAPAGYYLKPGQRNTRLEITASGSVQVPAYVRRVYVRAIGGGGGGAYSHQGATENTPSYGTVYIGSGGGAAAPVNTKASWPSRPAFLWPSPSAPAGSRQFHHRRHCGWPNPDPARRLRAEKPVGRRWGGRASYTFGGVSGRAADSRAAPARQFAGLSGYASPPGNGGGGGFRHSARGPGGHRSGSLNYAGGAGYPPFPRLGRGR